MNLNEWIKENTLVSIAGFLGTFAIIAGSVITFDTRYAHADQLQDMVKQQERQIDYLAKQNSQNLIFQIEYYEEIIRRLEAEKLMLVNRQRLQSQMRGIVAMPLNDVAAINEQLTSAKLKRDFLLRQMQVVPR